MNALANRELRLLASYSLLPLEQMSDVCLMDHHGGFWLVTGGEMRPITLAASGIPRQGCSPIHYNDVALQRVGSPLEANFNYSLAWARSALPHVNMRTVSADLP